MKAITSGGVVRAWSAQPYHSNRSFLGGRRLCNASQVLRQIHGHQILEHSANSGAVFVAQKLGAAHSTRTSRVRFRRHHRHHLSAEAVGSVRPWPSGSVDLGHPTGRGWPSRRCSSRRVCGDRERGPSTSPTSWRRGAMRTGSTAPRPSPSGARSRRRPPRPCVRCSPPPSTRGSRTSRRSRTTASRARRGRLRSPATTAGTSTMPTSHHSQDSRRASDPRFVAVIVLERPQSKLLGTITAMNTFRAIAEDALRTTRVQPDRP